MRLVAEGLGCARGARLLFEGLDLSIGAGRALIVTGPNGTGKSSLLQILAGLARPSAGAIRLEGGDPDLAPGEQAHYLGHADALKAALSVAENLAFWRAILGEPALGIADALDAVGLGALARLPVAVLSAGQRRRLAMARLLVVRRPLWLLDEPTTALDSEGQACFAALARAHLADGGLVVAATHAPLDFGPSDALRLGPVAAAGRVAS